MPPGNRIDARAGASMPGTGPGTGKTSVPMGRGFGGLNNFYLLQNRNISAFQNPHSGVPWGLGNSAQEMGARMNQAGNMLLADGRYVPDTMYNRTMGSMAPQQNMQPQGPNPDQMRWAQAFANAQQAPAGLPPPPAANNPATPFTNSLFTNGMRSNFVQQNPIAAGIPRGPLDRGVPTAPPPANPTNFSRAALIEGAKKSGEFADIMNAYNRNAQGTGYRMDENGNINPLSKSADAQGTSPFAREVYGPGAQDIAARRDFARGEAPVQQTTVNGMPALTKMNPYGTAIRQDLPASTGVRQGMMPDPLTGKMVPMRQWAADQSAVQATKFGPNAAQAGQDYFNPQAIQKSLSAQMAQAPQAKKFAPMQKPPIDTAQGLRPMQPSMAPLNSTPIVATSALSSPAETINPFRGLAAANPLNANDAASFRTKIGSSSQKKKSSPQSKTPLSDWVLKSPFGNVFSVTAK